MWIKTDYDFGLPYKVFTISTADLMVAEMRTSPERTLMLLIRDALRRYQNDPDQLERTLQGVVEAVRPDLKGGTIVGLRMSDYRLMFEITYVHPSFKPKVKLGSFAEPEPLLFPSPQEEGADSHVKVMNPGE